MCAEEGKSWIIRTEWWRQPVFLQNLLRRCLIRPLRAFDGVDSGFDWVVPVCGDALLIGGRRRCARLRQTVRVVPTRFSCSGNRRLN